MIIFFSVFTFPLLRGNPETALKDINSAVITESAAIRLFGNTDRGGQGHSAGRGSFRETIGQAQGDFGRCKGYPSQFIHTI